MRYPHKCYLTSPGEFNEETGFNDDSFNSSKSCRINYKQTKVLNTNGIETVSNIKVYFPATVKVNTSYKIKLPNESIAKPIIAYEPKNDINGILDHIVVYL